MLFSKLNNKLTEKTQQKCGTRKNEKIQLLWKVLHFLKSVLKKNNLFLYILIKEN